MLNHFLASSSILVAYGILFFLCVLAFRRTTAFLKVDSKAPKSLFNDAGTIAFRTIMSFFWGGITMILALTILALTLVLPQQYEKAYSDMMMIDKTLSIQQSNIEDGLIKK